MSDPAFLSEAQPTTIEDLNTVPSVRDDLCESYEEFEGSTTQSATVVQEPFWEMQALNTGAQLHLNPTSRIQRSGARCPSGRSEASAASLTSAAVVLTSSVRCWHALIVV
ncbi:uncharacterized protein LOC120664525 isoform X2 [Panicum virgatum]|uniref:uncharacterized protein LOC120664525 isoform X2 n=1 Tax=Panicum virgatum TaxID=38727 RepID=UPI0019D51CFC|nr:uncharacterized protein LOC120664525 isoform X2 [Panicum virgatum]